MGYLCVIVRRIVKNGNWRQQIPQETAPPFSDFAHITKNDGYKVPSVMPEGHSVQQTELQGLELFLIPYSEFHKSPRGECFIWSIKVHHFSSNKKKKRSYSFPIGALSGHSK